MWKVGSTDQATAATVRPAAEGMATATEDQVSRCFALQDEVWVRGASPIDQLANPAVTVGRTLSDTFAGIAPAPFPGFIAAQLAGAAVACAAVL